MRFDVPKKAFLALGGAVTSSVGTWKLYEEADPSIDTLLHREGLHYKPIEPDLNPEGLLSAPQTNGGLAKFNFTKGASIKNLLPSLEDISDDVDSSSSDSALSLDENFYQGFQVSDAAFIVDTRHWTSSAKPKNEGIVVKMELVIKDQSKNKALVIQNIITNLLTSGITFSNRYRYFLVEKSSGNWIVKHGYSSPDSWIFSGSQQAQKYLFSGLSGLNLEIVHNDFCAKSSSGSTCPEFKGTPAASYRYIAIWQPDPSASQSLFEPIKITALGTDELQGDVWGITKPSGQLSFDYFYKDKKWSSITQSTGNTDKIKNFFTPLFDEKNKKGKWVPLEDFCSSWSKWRKTSDFRWKEFCYSK